jgi:hypothetical protein
LPWIEFGTFFHQGHITLPVMGYKIRLKVSKEWCWA